MTALAFHAFVVVPVEISLAGAFDFYYAGSEVCELAGAEGGCDGLFEGDDEGAGEGQVGGRIANIFGGGFLEGSG